jgi:hypothetical protein
VQRMERSAPAERGPQPCALACTAPAVPSFHLSEIVNRGAEQRVRGRFAIMVKGEDMEVVVARQPFDQPQQRRHDPLSAGTIHAAGDDQTDAHLHQASHEETE